MTCKVFFKKRLDFIYVALFILYIIINLHCPLLLWSHPFYSLPTKTNELQVSVSWWLGSSLGPGRINTGLLCKVLAYRGNK